ncbi:MAG: hypothetical protein EOO92_27595 [Pedobacter sp.]|nr:MAG: hypothetical protein EOO92_27595 [Pedobacter sp.]
MNAQQMLNLRLMFDSYLDGQGNNDFKCIQTTIYNKVKTLGKKFSFCIDSAQVPKDGNAAYKAGLGIIYYKFEEGIPVITPFRHEFFHGFQDAFYTGGTAQYNTGTRTGFPNLEFEQALFYDILEGSGSATAMGSTADISITDEYRTWISSITNNNTKYPKQFKSIKNFAISDLIKTKSTAYITLILA